MTWTFLEECCHLGYVDATRFLQEPSSINHIPEDNILHCYRREKAKSYAEIFLILCGAPSLTKGRICNLHCSQTFRSWLLWIRNHTLLSSSKLVRLSQRLQIGYIFIVTALFMEKGIEAITNWVREWKNFMRNMATVLQMNYVGLEAVHLCHSDERMELKICVKKLF